MIGNEKCADLERTLFIQAPPEVVFRYFTVPHKIVSRGVREAAMELVPGGMVRWKIQSGEVMVGEVVELDPPHHFVFTWGWEGSDDMPPGTSRVELTFTGKNGGTELHLLHSGIPLSTYDDHVSGWDRHLPMIVKTAEEDHDD